MGTSIKEQLSLLPPDELEAFLDTCSERDIIEMGREEWWYTQRPEQVPPDGNWTVHLYLGGRGTGKALALDTPVPVMYRDPMIDESTQIPVPGGWKTMGDLVVGDQVFDESGNPCNVTAVYDVNPQVAYRVTFADGSWIDACSEHQWITWEHLDRKALGRSSETALIPADWPNWRSDSGLGPRVRNTEDIRASLHHGARGDGNHSVPLTAPLVLPEVGLPIDPWALGYWLGNGSRNSGQVTGNAEDELEVRTLYEASGFHCGVNYYRSGVKSGDRAGTFAVSPAGLMRALRHSGLLGSRAVPAGYLWSSIEQRRALLAGLLDSDGYLDARTQQVEFCSTTLGLAEAVRDLAVSLGQKAILKEGRSSLRGVDHGPKYRVTWRADYNPFRLSRKAAKWRPPTAGGQGRRTRHRMITSVEPIAPVPMRCITVDSPNSLYLAGRSMIPTHNTKSGAEWIVERCEKFPFTASGHPANRLVMAYNVSDALTTCIEGESGILSILRRKGMVEDRDYSYTKAPKPKIVFLETGCVIHFTGANKPDVVRGLNLSDAWLDEIVKWPDPEQIWKEGVHHALRSDVPGDKPRVFVTTTPKPIEILKKWTKRKDGFVSLSRGSTFDNMANLNAEFLREIRLEYEGTLIGRQEIYGELLDDMEGPLFSLATINDNRVEEIPDDIGFRVVGVDPCLTGGENGDLMGCVAAYRDRKDHYYVVEDASVRLSGRDAARHVWKVFARHSADVLAVETNLGKQWLTEILRSTYKEMQDEGIFPQYTTPPIKEIHSNHGKKLRAEPVAIRYQQKRVHHVGAFEHLETQMVGWDPTDSKVSPDRLDALVHAIRYLMEGENRTVRFFSPTAVTVRGL